MRARSREDPLPDDVPTEPKAPSPADAPVEPNAAARRPAPELNGAARKRLRALAHPLKPVVMVGEAGLSPSVLAALDEALARHELVKVRLRQPEDKRGTARELAEAMGAALCGVVGHTVILYRPDPDAPRIELPGGA
ncbi:MAG: ribosome assembly RNA-binding protein YhbY [Spirochaetaceae bacterium]|nr:ribosome assembly RNA-binding protein YhbY [Spirochaetaceae bacterium]